MVSKYLKLIAAGLFGFLIGITLKSAYEQNTFHAFTWAEPPVVVNCYGEALPEAVVVRAIDYWVLRGFPISFYEMKPPKSLCDNEFIEGFIIIRRDKNLTNESALAQTARHTRLTRLVGAVIRLRPGTYNLDLLLEHEMGHAMGLGHVEVKGHIMHPLYMSMGANFWIPE